MENYNLTQTGPEVQEILDNATPQSELTTETQRAQLAEQTLQGNIDAEAQARANAISAETQRAQLAEQTLQTHIDNEALTRENADTLLQTNIGAEETRAKAAEKQNADDIDALEALLPSGVSPSNKLVAQQAIEAIIALIPSAASALNQLADKAFVNSSIATNTATFRGTFNLVSDLHLPIDANHETIALNLLTVTPTADNNDFCYVQIPDSAETPTVIASTDRYKFNGTEWAFEYTLNTSGFTAAQWAAINSGITAAILESLTGIPALIPSEATDQNQLADKAYVLTQILLATPAFKGQFTTITQLQAVTGAKAGDIGIVRTKDTDGHDVFAFYQYKNDQWTYFYSLSYHPQDKPATTGLVGEAPYNGMGRVELPMNWVEGWPNDTWLYYPYNDVVYLMYYWNGLLYAPYNSGTQEGLGLDDNLVVKPLDYNIADIEQFVGERYLPFTESSGVWTITKPDDSTITSTELNNTNIYKINDPTHLGINVLTQAMLNRPNTIYVIQYDFTLCEDITIPANCVLEFDGGSISGNYAIDFSNCLNTEIYSSWMSTETLLKSIVYMSFKTLVIDNDIHLTSPIKTTTGIQSLTIRGQYSTQNWADNTEHLRVYCENCSAIDIIGYTIVIKDIHFIRTGDENIDSPIVKLSYYNNDLDSSIHNCKFEGTNNVPCISTTGRGLEVSECYFNIAYNTPNEEKACINIHQCKDKIWEREEELVRNPKYAGRAFIIHDNRVHNGYGRLVRFYKYTDEQNRVYCYRGIKIFDNLCDIGGTLCKIDAPNYDTLIMNNTCIGGVDVYHQFMIDTKDSVNLQIVGNNFDQLDNTDAGDSKKNSTNFCFLAETNSELTGIIISNNIIKTKGYFIDSVQNPKVTFNGLLITDNVFTSESFSATNNNILRTYNSLSNVVIKNNINLGTNVRAIWLGDSNINNIDLSNIVIRNNKNVGSYIYTGYSSTNPGISSISNVETDLTKSEYDALGSYNKGINNCQLITDDGLIYTASDVPRIARGRRLNIPLIGDITGNYPMTDRDYGQYILDNANYLRPFFRLNGTTWVDGLGQSIGLRHGSRNSRPTLAGDKNIGYMYFDTFLGKPIWWNGTAWVDATGTSV